MRFGAWLFLFLVAAAAFNAYASWYARKSDRRKEVALRRVEELCQRIEAMMMVWAISWGDQPEDVKQRLISALEQLKTPQKG